MLMMFGCHIWPQPLSWHQPQLECTENVNCKKEQERVLPFGLDSRKLQDEWLFVFVREDKYQKHSFLLFTLVKRTCWVSLISIYLLCFNNFSYMAENPCTATLVNFIFVNFGWQFMQFSTNIKNSQSAGPKPNILEKSEWSWILLFLESHLLIQEMVRIYPSFQDFPLITLQDKMVYTFCAKFPHGPVMYCVLD